MIRAATARSDATDEMLMVRYQRGDREAFAELVRRYLLRVHNFVVRQLGHCPSAEAVTQEVFLRVVRNAAEFKHEARFSTWLFTIARNLCIDASPARRPSQPSDSDLTAAAGPRRQDPVDPQRPHPLDGPPAASEIKHRLARAVEQLPEEQREAFLLREVANLPFEEIAEVTGVTTPTAKQRLRYALDRLQATLAQFEEFTRALR